MTKDELKELENLLTGLNGLELQLSTHLKIDDNLKTI